MSDYQKLRSFDEMKTIAWNEPQGSLDPIDSFLFDNEPTARKDSEQFRQNYGEALQLAHSRGMREAAEFMAAHKGQDGTMMRDNDGKLVWLSSDEVLVGLAKAAGFGK